MASQVRVYIACSLDGYIAGPDDDLSWLPHVDPQAQTEGVSYEAFTKDVGCILMGRQTYEVVCGFPGDWPYGQTPVLIATQRALEPKVSTVKAVKGSISEMVRQAQEAAQGKDVYLDGGQLIRSALDEGLVDELIITQVPKLLGGGVSLFAGLKKAHTLKLVEHHLFGGSMVQLVLRPERGASAEA